MGPCYVALWCWRKLGERRGKIVYTREYLSRLSSSLKREDIVKCDSFQILSLNIKQIKFCLIICNCMLQFCDWKFQFCCKIERREERERKFRLLSGIFIFGLYSKFRILFCSCTLFFYVSSWHNLQFVLRYLNNSLVSVSSSIHFFLNKIL